MELVQGKDVAEVGLIKDVEQLNEAILIVDAHLDHFLHARVLQRLSIQLVQLGVDETLKSVLEDLLRLLEDLHENLLQARVEGRFAGLSILQVLLVALEHWHEEL